MESHDSGAEATGEARDHLRSQADFRNEYQHLFAGSQHFFNQLQVDLGFAAAGNSLQQEAIEAVAGFTQYRHDLLLLGTEGECRFGQLRGHCRALGLRGLFDEILLCECLQYGARIFAQQSVQFTGT